MKMTMKEHFTMFATIADTIRACTNLNEEEVADFATNITNAITKNLDIEVEVTEADEEFMVGGLLMALIGGLME
jgi:hypothetical protein